jgi:hypothetical protein
MIFMVSSRDRNCQRIEMTREVIARAPPPAFLFPFYDFKDLDPPAGRPIA